MLSPLFTRVSAMVQILPFVTREGRPHMKHRRWLAHCHLHLYRVLRLRSFGSEKDGLTFWDKLLY
jgi:hypothetical protein